MNSTKRRFAIAAKISVLLAATIVWGMSVMTSNESSASENGNKTAVQDQLPVPRPAKTIDLSYVGRESGLTSILRGWNRKTFDFHVMSFSPDSRYLAIAGGPISTMTDIIVWDIQNNRQQSRIRFPMVSYTPDEGGFPVWSRDSKTIWFGKKQQWDAMSGAALPDTPTEEGIKRPNKDGTKILVVTNYKRIEPSTLKIYDPDNWTLLKDIYLNGYNVTSVSWTAQDKILVGIDNTRETFGKVVDGRMNEHRPDVAFKLIDPFGKDPVKTVWFPAVPDEKWAGGWKKSMHINMLAASTAASKVAISDARFLDTETLEISGFSLRENEGFNAGPNPFATDQVFSTNGQYLFVKTPKRFDSNTLPVNFIVNVSACKVVGTFIGGNNGITVSPDGKCLAYGDDHETIQILSLESKQSDQ